MSDALTDHSTESASATDPTSAVSADQDENLDITNVPVVVTWSNPAEHDGFLQHLSHSTHDHLTLHLHRDASSHSAFFQLRANVALKNRRDRTNVLFSIPPENIQTLALSENDEGMEVASTRLGTSTRCLRFDLGKPGSLIVPKGDITPKHKASRIVLDSLRTLVSQTAFSMYLPSAKTSDAHMAALCAAVTSGTLHSTDKFLDIASLYGGKGGRVLETETLDVGSIQPHTSPSMPKDQGDSPPSYDELSSEPNTSRLSHVQKFSNKRRRASSNADAASSPRPYQCVMISSIEDMCRKMMERIDSGFGELGSRLDCMEQRLSSLETCVERYAEKLGASIQQVEDRSSEQAGALRDELDAGLYDVRKETQDIITAQVEDEMYVARDHLEDHIKDELAAIEERLEAKLEEDLTSANVSLEFSWNR